MSGLALSLEELADQPPELSARDGAGLLLNQASPG